MLNYILASVLCLSLYANNPEREAPFCTTNDDSYSFMIENKRINVAFGERGVIQTVEATRFDYFEAPVSQIVSDEPRYKKVTLKHWHAEGILSQGTKFVLDVNAMEAFGPNNIVLFFSKDVGSRLKLGDTSIPIRCQIQKPFSDDRI